MNKACEDSELREGLEQLEAVGLTLSDVVGDARPTESIPEVNSSTDSGEQSFSIDQAMRTRANSQAAQTHNMSANLHESSLPAMSAGLLNSYVGFEARPHSHPHASIPPLLQAYDVQAGRSYAPRPPLPPQILSQRPGPAISTPNADWLVGNDSSPRVFETLSQSLNASRQRNQQKVKSLSDIHRFFVPVNRPDANKKTVYYECIQCGMSIYNKKKRSKVAHVILCSETEYNTRRFFRERCSGSDMPPLLAKPFYGMTVSMARRLEKEMERRKKASGEEGHFGDPTRLPRYGKYVIARQKLKLSTPIRDCTEKEQRVATDLLLELIVDENLPFSICDKKGGHPRALWRLLDYLRPGYSLPLGYKVGGDLLDRFYLETVGDLKSRLKWMLQDSRATLMFDGSEDVNGAPMINVMVRLMGSSRVETTTFFLSTVYTGYDTVDSSYYVRIAEKIIAEFVGFENVAGVVTDNTGSVKNAREEMENRHFRLVASQDQAHVADRLMADIGKIGWVKSTLKTLSTITGSIRRLRKLRARLVVLMKDYNDDIRKAKRTSSNETQNAEGEDGEGLENEENAVASSGGEREGSTTATREQDILPGTGDRRNENIAYDEVNHGSGIVDECLELSGVVLPDYQPGCNDEDETVEDSPGSDSESEDELEQSPNQAHTFGTNNTNEKSCNPVRRARMLKKVSAVRFASSEKLLDEYLSIRPVLLRLVDDPLFDELYKVKNVEERVERENLFISPIRSEELKFRVQQLHAIFQACRTYLRVFDSETSLSSEVFEATRILEETLESLPLEFLPEPKEANRGKLLAVFENRKRGPLPNMRKVKILLLSDLHIAAALLDPYRTPYDVTPYMSEFRRHLDRYLSGVNLRELGIEEQHLDLFAEEIVTSYSSVRRIWEKRGFIQELSESSNTGGTIRPTAQSRRTKSPISWWTSGGIAKPKDEFERKAMEELIEFARRTLSVSPTATATERTFSLEGRIHSRDRSSLSPQKVTKLLFCQWNARVLRQLALRSEADELKELETQTLNMRKLRQFRSAVNKAREEGSRSSSNPQDSVDNNQNSLRRNPSTHPPASNDGGSSLLPTTRTNLGRELTQQGPDNAPLRGTPLLYNGVDCETVTPAVAGFIDPRTRATQLSNVGVPHHMVYAPPQQCVSPHGYQNQVLTSMPLILPQSSPSLQMRGGNVPTWVQMVQTTVSYPALGTQSTSGIDDMSHNEQQRVRIPRGSDGIAQIDRTRVGIANNISSRITCPQGPHAAQMGEASLPVPNDPPFDPRKRRREN